jgi:hypothetical protein
LIEQCLQAFQSLLSSPTSEFLYVPFTSGMFNSGGSGPSGESRSDDDSEKISLWVSSEGV